MLLAEVRLRLELLPQLRRVRLLMLYFGRRRQQPQKAWRFRRRLRLVLFRRLQRLGLFLPILPFLPFLPFMRLGVLATGLATAVATIGS